MNEEKARKILGSWIKENDNLTHTDPYINADHKGISLDGGFTRKQLKAIFWWMKYKLK
ncbi:hypothetical protein SAMN03080615_01612 [Amphritea atlantica]|uniref:Uncharacterized protein n=1 Tax=Amphritea atlantica TaxID=355243 RepID=A0A1H9GCX7_9GAMM|nr:hypothetical protein [Amphritea atlantica]SEQ47950.1 hypothetical protein SAMN03080615_01612 [Amphritea atlantica]